MECGTDDVGCQMVIWLSENSFILRDGLAYFDSAWNSAGTTITGVVREHGEKIVAALSFCFAVWRYFRFREGVLYKRLIDYVRDSDERLQPASSQIREAILRPGRTATVPQPSFAIELREVFENSGWSSIFRTLNAERQFATRLDRAMLAIQKRERTVEYASRSLRKQRAQVHLLTGAVQAGRARAETDRDRARQFDDRALREFQMAREILGRERDLVSRECEAFQFMRLGQHNLAFEAFEQLESLATTLPACRLRDLTIARSKRFKAQILQNRAGVAASQNAWSQIGSQNDATCSLNLRRAHGPYAGWDAIEQAEIHYVAAYVASRFPTWLYQVDSNLRASDEHYECILREPLKFFGADRALRQEATRGQQRVRDARNGQFDEKWLAI